MCAGDRSGQKVSDSLKLLLAFVSHLMWVLGTEGTQVLSLQEQYVLCTLNYTQQSLSRPRSP